MTYEPKSEHRFTFGLWTVGNPGIDPFGEPVREKLSPVQLVELLAEVGAWGVNFHDNDLVPIDASVARARPDRGRLQEGAGRDRPGRADGDHQPVPRPRLPRRRVHRERSQGPRLCAAEDDARDRPGRRARRDDVRVLGWTRRRRDRRRQGPAPCARLVRGRHQLPLRVREGSRLRPAVRVGAQAERAAWRHLPPHDGRHARVHRDARARRDGGREPRGRPRAHGRAELHAPRRAGLVHGQAVPHRSERPDPGPVRPGPPVRLGEPQGGVLPGEVPGGRGLHGEPALRRARVSHVGLRGREGVRARLHADVPDPQGEGRAVERRPRHPGAGRGRLRR